MAVIGLPFAATCFLVGASFGGTIAGALALVASAIGVGALARSMLRFSAGSKARIAQDSVMARSRS